MSNNDNGNVLKQTEALLREYTLCNHCLGRLFGWLSTDTTNEERGRSLKLVLSIIADERIKSGKKESGKELLIALASNGMFNPAKERLEQESLEFSLKDACHLCHHESESIFEMIPKVVNRVVEDLQQFEFASFLVGSIPPPYLVEHQDEVRAKHELIYAETLKSHFNRELGRTLQKAIEKPVDFGRPDIVIVYDVLEDKIRLQINPIFVSGRYRKLVRGIPQSRWDCKKCKGKGCEDCNNTGRKYPDSVAEYVGTPIMESMQGSRFKFHAAGREDIDALMLGSGRPFVVEVSEPKKRSVNFRELEQEVNTRAEGNVEVLELGLSERAEAQWLKEESPSNIKEYSAVIWTEEDVPPEKLTKAHELLFEIDVQQRTPTRVAHRRSDLVRQKHVYEVRLSKIGPNQVQGFFKVQGGTYVKELISGDDGRTIPSLSEVLGTTCICRELTVTAIHSLFPDHNP